MDVELITEEDLIISARYKSFRMDIQHFHCKHCGALLWDTYYYRDYNIRSVTGKHYPECSFMLRAENPHARKGEMVWI